MTGKLLSRLAMAVTAGCSVFGIRSVWEQPPFETLDMLDGGVEVRRYGPRLVAETTVEATDEETARNAAFRILAAYIFGENRRREEVAMTTPVAVGDASEPITMTAPVEAARAGAGRWSMRFFLPAALTPESAPEPTDPRVRLFEALPETLAVLRFSGRGRPDAVAEHLRELLGRLPGSRWQAAGEPVVFFYDPPWTLWFLRRNEVAVRVERLG